MKMFWIIAVLPTLICSREFTEYKECCQYCFSRQQKWIRVSPAWNMTVDNKYITDFTSPVSVTPGDFVVTSLQFRDLEYWTIYGGVPIQIMYRDIALADTILQEQYIEIDLLTPKDVGGVTTQGGSYHEGSLTLFKQAATWMTSFALSYLDMTSGVFTYVTQTDGHIKVFKGNDDVETSLVSSFTSSVTTTHIRVHPLGAEDADGDVTRAFVRVSAIVCSMDPCGQKPLPCDVSEWSGWTECLCQGLEGCHQRRTRSVRRHNACGGTPCPYLTYIQPCVPLEPVWVRALQYLGGLGGILLLVGFVMAIILRQVILERRRKAFRKTRLAREHERQEAAQVAELRLAEDMSKGNDLSAFEEKEIVPVTRPGLFVYSKAHHDQNQDSTQQVQAGEEALQMAGPSAENTEGLRQAKLDAMFTGSLVAQEAAANTGQERNDEEGDRGAFDEFDFDEGIGFGMDF